MEIKKPTLTSDKPSGGYKGGLPEEIYSLINKQIEVEAFSSQIYLQMAAWCDPQGYTGAAKFYSKHAEEERKHMLKLYEFLADKNMVAETPMLKAPQKEYVDLVDVVETALEHEFMVTMSYEKACEVAMNLPCHQTFQLLQWFVHEQVEEESLFQTIVDKAHILAKGGMNGLSYIELDGILEDLV
jgi:ferritin